MKRKTIFITLPFIVLVLMIIPALIYFYNFGNDFSRNNSDWGSFGSYIGGTIGAILSALSFTILAFTLVITINYNESNKKIALTTLKTERKSYKEQLDHQRNEFNLLLIRTYSESLSNLFNNKRYFRYSSNGSSRAEINKKIFLDEVIAELIRLGNINPKTDFFTLSAMALNNFRVRYDDECIILSSIEKILIDEKNPEIKQHFKTIFSAGTNPEDVFWLQMFLCDCSEGYKDKIIGNNLIKFTNRIMDAFTEHHKTRSEKK